MTKRKQPPDMEEKFEYNHKCRTADNGQHYNFGVGLGANDSTLKITDKLQKLHKTSKELYQDHALLTWMATPCIYKGGCTIYN